MTVAPITTPCAACPRGAGLAGEGEDHDSVVSCDCIVTVPIETLGRQLGFLLADQEPAISEAIRTAFDLVRHHHEAETKHPQLREANSPVVAPPLQGVRGRSQRHCRRPGFGTVETLRPAVTASARATPTGCES